MNKFTKLVFTGVFFLFTVAITNGCASTPDEQPQFTDSASKTDENSVKGTDESASKDLNSGEAEGAKASKAEPEDAEDENTAAVDIKGRSSTDLKVPQTVEQYKLSKVVRVSPDVVQAVYKNTENQGKVLTVTKAYGGVVPQVLIPNFSSKNIFYRAENIKGLYIILGLENSLCRSASWVSGDFGFAFMADEGFTYENLDSFIQHIY